MPINQQQGGINAGDPPFTVMIVDDSSVIRSILKKILETSGFITLVGEAENGSIAIERARQYQPEIILLDIEMPIMDGISALPLLLEASAKSKIIMVSTLTDTNASISIKALGRGAADYLQKPEAGLDKDIFKADLLRKIKGLGYAGRNGQLSNAGSLLTGFVTKDLSAVPTPTVVPRALHKADVKPLAIAIASSTGGPQALHILFDGLKNHMPNIPIFITQHMPPLFTKYLASSLATTNSIACYEASEGMEAIGGNVYIAPGDFHMQIKTENNKTIIRLNKDEPENFCRPSADPMLRSLEQVYGNKVLVVVLTGMGQDGLLGAKLFAEKGGVVIAQDQPSSVVWGMPGAVCEAGIASGIYPIGQIASRIMKICNK